MYLQRTDGMMHKVTNPSEGIGEYWINKDDHLEGNTEILAYKYWH